MINCLAIDDEPLALTQLAGYINKVPFMNLVAACSDGYQAMEVLSKNSVDVIFTDINMPDLNGLDFVKALNYKPLIVFTTAYSEYAVEGFKADAIDYLLKPFGYNDFLKSANKVLKQTELIKNNKQSQEETQDYIFVKADYKQIKINTSDILYIEGMSEYIKIFTFGNPPVITLMPLKEIEQRLKPGQFIRIHRSFIINMNMIEEYSKSGVKLKSSSTLPIGDQYRDKFLAAISL